jgi:hypothetical protein
MVIETVSCRTKVGLVYFTTCVLSQVYVLSILHMGMSTVVLWVCHSLNRKSDLNKYGTIRIIELA